MTSSIDYKVMEIKGSVPAQNKPKFVHGLRDKLLSVGWVNFISVENNGDWTQFYTVTRKYPIVGTLGIGSGCLHTQNFDQSDSEGLFMLFVGAPSEKTVRLIRENALKCLADCVDEYGNHVYYSPNQIISPRII